MKKKILSFITVLSVASLITGCNTTKYDVQNEETIVSTTDNENDDNDNLTVTAADGYIIKLNSPAEIMLNDGTIITSNEVTNGKIVFPIKYNNKLLNGAVIHIPKDALVDADNDGTLTERDTVVYGDLFTKITNLLKNVNVNLVTTDVFLSEKFDDNNFYITTDPIKSLENSLRFMANNDIAYNNYKDVYDNPGFRFFLGNAILAKINNVFLKSVLSINQTADNFYENYYNSNYKTAIKDANIDLILKFIRNNLNDGITLEDGLAELNDNISQIFEKITVYGDYQDQAEDWNNFLSKLTYARTIVEDYLETVKNIKNLQISDDEKNQLLDKLISKITQMFTLYYNSDIPASSLLTAINQLKGDVTNIDKYYDDFMNQVGDNMDLYYQFRDKFKIGKQNLDSEAWNNFK